MSEPVFTADMVTHVIASGPGSWKKYVVPRLADVPSVKWLEIGSYEGRSALWTVANVLHGAGSLVVCVDPWTRWDVAARFNYNTTGVGRIVQKRGYSRDVLPTLAAGTFHGAYVDGSHVEADVAEDIRLVLPLLAPRGIVIFDDYDVVNPRERPLAQGVRPAVDAFLAREGSRVEVVYRGRQVIVQVGG